MLGHKAACARLQLLSEGPSSREALVWNGRKLSCGRSAACALQLESPLASRCHLLIEASLAAALSPQVLMSTAGLSQAGPKEFKSTPARTQVDAASGSIWLTDSSSHGSLVLEVPSAEAVGLDASSVGGLRWDQAALLHQASHRCTAQRHLTPTLCARLCTLRHSTWVHPCIHCTKPTALLHAG